MNRTSARAPLAAALVAASLFAACASAPDLAIIAPAPGATLGAASDLDANTPGLQIAVDATTSAADGSIATASGGGAIARATAQGGQIHFDSVTLLDGAATLTVAVVDAKNDKAAVVSASYSVDSFSSGCRISTPANHASFGGDPGDTGLISVVVQAVCRGLAQGVQAGLLENDDSAPGQLQSPGADGSVSFNADLIPGANLLAVVAAGVSYDVVEVTLNSSRCRAEIEPPSGSSFNLAGNDGAFADLSASAPGVQADISVLTGCSDGSSASLAILRGGVAQLTSASTVHGGSATFNVTLPDGALDVQAFIGSPGQEGASRHAAYQSDGTAPTISVLSPTNGSLLGAADDVGTGLQFFARMRGEIGGLDSGGFAALEIDQGTPQAQEVVVTPDLTSGIFSTDVALTAGAHEMVAKVRRASGNSTTTSAIDFTVVFSGSALAIATPSDGSTLGLSSLTPGAGGAQALFLVESVGLAGAAVAVSCGSGIGGTGTIGADGTATIPIALPISSCAGALFSCTATANSGAVISAPVAFSADDTAPTPTITAPTISETASSSIELKATTSCSGEGQLFVLDDNGTVLQTGSVQGNALDLASVPLQPGLNTLHLTVSDAAHNSGTTQVSIDVITGSPAVIITSPANGATLTSAISTITVQVDNRPAGSAVQLILSDAAGARAPLSADTATVSGHLVATFANIALPEGAVAITASVTDPVAPAPAPTTATVNVTVSTGRPLCDVVVPADGTSWTAANDSEPSVTGFQHDMQVSTTATGKVTLTVTPATGSAASIDDNSGGNGSLRTVTFPNVGLPGDGNYTVSATCTGPSAGASLPNSLSYFATGPVASFVAPQLGATLGSGEFDANGETAIQVAAAGAGTGGEISLSADCGSGSTSYGPSVLVSGGFTFHIPLLAAGQSGSCTLTAQAQTSTGVLGLAVSETVTVNRSTPTPLFIVPTSGADFGPTASQLDCSGSGPALKQVQVSLGSDTALASGLSLSVSNASGINQVVSQTPTLASGVFTWTEVALAPESNTLAVTATDTAGNTGQASVTFSARCASLDVALTFSPGGPQLGFAQDRDPNTPGVQVTAQVQTTGAANGSSVRICTTALSATPGGCTTPGTGSATVTSGTPVIQSNLAQFIVTLPDGPLPVSGNPASGQQTVYAEVTDVATDASQGQAVDVRATPPTVTSIQLAEDTQGQTLSSGPDGALNQTEIDLANGTVHFHVVFGAGSAVAGQMVQIFSTSAPSTVLGSATVAQNGDGAAATIVPVALSLLNTGGDVSYVFYAQVSDDAGNQDSIPGDAVNNVAATTLGTANAPFVIAPDPTVTLVSPGPGTNRLNASNDARCVSGTCPDTDPLIYAFAASTSAPDSSAAGATSSITFFAGGAAIAPGNGETNPTQTTNRAVSGVELPIANGTSVLITAQIEDPYGNVATALTPVTARVDSVPPELLIAEVEGQTPGSLPVTIDQATVNAQVNIDANGLGGTLESGQQVTVFADGNLVGQATYLGSSTGSGSVLVPINVSSGLHSLVAKASDLAMNAGASPAVSVDQIYAGPTIALSSPAPVQGGTLWLGLSTASGSGANQICAPSLTYSTINVPDNQTVQLWVVGSSASCGSPPGTGVQTGTVASGSATIATAPFTLHDTATGIFCAQTTDALSNVATTQQAFQCDLQMPTVAWVSPIAGTTFAANGQTQLTPADTLSTSTDPHMLGLASAQVSVKAPTGGTLVLSIDEANTPTTTTTSFVTCTVPALSTATTVFALSSSNCSTTSGTGQLLAPVDFGQLLQHTLTASFSASLTSGNAATPATENVNIDVAEPSAVTPAVAMQQLIGVGTVSISTLPGDDQTAGTPSTWEVRYATTQLTTATWSSATLANANLAGAFPSGPTSLPTSFQVVFPAGNAMLFLGVRAKDRIGNLGDLLDANVVTVDTQPTGSTVAIRDNPGQTTPTTPTSSNPADRTMRVANLDGDPYDDIILNYSDDSNGDGRIIVYFGGNGGVANPTEPLVLSGTLTPGSGGLLGTGQSFDVGDFDGDGLADIAAAETNLTIAHVLIWTGASILQWRNNGSDPSTPPTPIVLSDSAGTGALVGGTVRAVGHITGGTGIGDDLAISNYTVDDGSSTSFALGLYQRGGDWSIHGTDLLFSTTTSPAKSIIALPTTVAGQSGDSTDGSTLEVAPFTYTGMSTDLPGVALALLYLASGNMNVHEVKVFGGDPVIAPSLTWANGTPVSDPVGVHDTYGYYMVGGHDAIGDGHQDILIADADFGVLLAYDGETLLGQGAATPNPIHYDPTAEGDAHVGVGAALIPDMDGDGKWEITGGLDAAGTEPFYLWFGQTGDTPATPLPFFATCSSFTSTQFCFSPPRGQHILPAPVFSGSPFGQAASGGHITSTSVVDLVVLSQDTAPLNGTTPQGTLVILH